MTKLSIVSQEHLDDTQYIFNSIPTEKFHILNMAEGVSNEINEIIT